MVRKLATLAASGVLTLAVWTLWLGLGILLAVQAYVATNAELKVPRFVERALEERLAMSGVRASFGRTIFDPSGRLLAEDVRITLPGFEEPTITARAIFVRLDLWALAAKRFEPLELRASGVALKVPAMLSPSGRADEIVSDLDADVVPRGGDVSVESLSFRLGNLAVSARGTVRLGSVSGAGNAPLPLADFLARDYAPMIRQLAGALGQLSVLDRPVVRAVLDPTGSAGATARVTLEADGLTLPAPAGVRLAGLRVSGVLPIAAASPGVELAVAADEAVLQGKVVVRGLRLKFHGSWEPDLVRAGRSPIEFQETEAAAASASGWGVTAVAPVARASRAAGPAGYDVGVEALLWSEPLSVQARIGTERREATVRFHGSVAPGALDAASAWARRDLGRFVAFSSPTRLSGDARFGPGWSFAGATARVSAAGVTARGVRIDEVRGVVDFDGKRLSAPEAYARVGEDSARGSFEEELATKRYHFLLQGRLRPLDITPWIAGGWWKDLFSHLSFPAAPPEADVDLRGCWTNGREASVFISVDSRSPVLLGQGFDRARARLFARPQFEDGLAFSLSRGGEWASGTFSRTIDFDEGLWTSLDFDLSSRLDLKSAAQLIGPAGASSFAPFAFARPPSVRISGHFDGPGAPGGSHRALHLWAESDGEFRYHDFPFERVAFTADVHDSDLSLDPVSASVAGGAFTGTGRVSGEGAARTVSLQASLKGASLGQAIGAFETFSAKRSGEAKPGLEAFVKGKSDVHMDVLLSASGRFDDPLSYHGTGSASLQGPALGQIHLLGLLSDLLRFTALRFTNAHADFKLDGPRIEFPQVMVTGANSAITAAGTYDIEGHRLDFKARIDPLKESKGLPQRFVDFMISPLTTALEVKLAGTIEKPSWSFANGPLNLLRGLGNPAQGPAQPSPLKDDAAP